MIYTPLGFTGGEVTPQEIINHLETETVKAVNYGTDVAYSLMAFIALATLVAMFLKKL